MKCQFCMGKTISNNSTIYQKRSAGSGEKLQRIYWYHVRRACSLLAVLCLTAGVMPLYAAAETTQPITDLLAVTSENDIVSKDADGKTTGEISYDISPANKGTNIAIGENSKVFIGGGTQESVMSFGETVDPTYKQVFIWNIQTGYNIHSNSAAKENLPSAIAIGQNTYARTGSIVIGDHTLEKNNIAIGDTVASYDKTGKPTLLSYGVASTNVGTNSYTNGPFATTYGSYNIQSSPYPNGYPLKNGFATVIGTFNSNESMNDWNSTSGVANYIGGVANKVTASNGSVVLGAGNTVTDSIKDFDASSLEEPAASVTAMQNALIEGVRKSSGGAAMVIGGGNQVDSSTDTQLMGVNNESKKDTYTLLDGFTNVSTSGEHLTTIGSGNTMTDSSYTQLLGDNRVLTDVDNSIILGSAESAETPLTTNVDNVTILGYNANANVAGGVALGYGSIALTGAGIAGYVPTGVTKSGSDSTWTSTAAAVSVGDAANDLTRQITGVAAGTADTDAVNVAQLKAVESKSGGSKITLTAGNGIRLVQNTTTGAYTISALFTDTDTNTVVTKKAASVVVPITSDTGTGTDTGGTSKSVTRSTTVVTSGTPLAVTTQLADDNGLLTEIQTNIPLGVKGDTTNITTTASGANLVVSLNKDISVDSVTVTNGPVIDSNGISNANTISVTDGPTINSDGITNVNKISVTNGPTINSSGIDMNNQKITNVADGSIAEGSKDAVNGGQIYNLQNQLTGLNDTFGNEINGLSRRVDGLDRRIDKVGAGAAALAALHPTDFNPDDKWDFSLGYGNYRSANAVALGAFYHPNASTIFSIGATVGNDNNMVNAGVTFKVGSGSSTPYYTPTQASQIIGQLKTELAQVKADKAAQQAKVTAQQKQIDQQPAEINKMKAQIDQLLSRLNMG